MNVFSVLLIPVLVMLILIVGVYKNVNCFEVFKKGAFDGLDTIVKLIPTYIGLFVAITVFKASGILESLLNIISPICEIPKIISENLPLAFMRPVSGSASLAILENIIANNGADSDSAMAACIMMGSTETVFYTMSVYTAETKIKSMPGVLPVSLAANFVSCILALLWVVIF